ncbi:phospholipase D-like protein [Serinibacter salmoneus]|uniref:Phospholipase D-like protein n=2 Tax=Serinibacter salmoneus TaxID=556530 RepID=A0A2A9D2J0_9MICO|nr:phospholipase D-like protein [Serinibacter salmoneus]
MGHRKNFRDLPRKRKVQIVIVAAAQLALHGYAWRDLITRPADQVKGPKLPWGLALLVNWIGPIAYLAAGREKRDALPAD